MLREAKQTEGPPSASLALGTSPVSTGEDSSGAIP